MTEDPVPGEAGPAGWRWISLGLTILVAIAVWVIVELRSAPPEPPPRVLPYPSATAGDAGVR